MKNELGEGKHIRKWGYLNKDCLAIIFEKTGIETLIFSAPFVCKNWYTASLYPQCWKVLDFGSVFQTQVWRSNLSFSFFPYNELIELVVNRSQGVTTEVSLDNSIKFLKDLVHHISNGCPRLKSLNLPQYQDGIGCISNHIKKWKHLEHLRIYGCTDEDFSYILTEISTHCKNFASLTYCKYISDEEATAIVTLLPNIKSLNLSGSKLNRKNLVKILSECKKLEFLDVSCCEGFYADSGIREMASHIQTFLSDGSAVSRYRPYNDDSDDDDYYY